MLEASAAQGNVDSLTELSGLYSVGKSTPLNVTYDNAQSQTRIATISNVETIAKDSDKSYKFAQKAADLGSPLGMMQVGVCYATGLGITKDINSAVNWLIKARQ